MSPEALDKTAEYFWDGSSLKAAAGTEVNDCILKAQEPMRLAAPFMSQCKVVADPEVWRQASEAALPAVTPGREMYPPSINEQSVWQDSGFSIAKISEKATVFSEMNDWRRQSYEMPSSSVKEYLISQFELLAALPLLAAKTEQKIISRILRQTTNQPCSSFQELAAHSLGISGQDSNRESVLINRREVPGISHQDLRSLLNSHHLLTIVCHPHAIDMLEIPQWASKKFRPIEAPPSVIATSAMPPPENSTATVLCLDISSMMLFLSPIKVKREISETLWQIEASISCTGGIWNFSRPNLIVGNLDVR